MTKHNVYRKPQTVREYGYAEGRPVEQSGSPSGFLLGWDAIDDQADAVAKRRPPMYVVIGEFERDGARYPELVVSATYMEWAGYVRSGHSWRPA